jgi:hypothetical protein
MLNDLSDSDKIVIDVLSITTVTATLLSILPAIAALFTIIWTAIRIYETQTVQRMLGKIKDDDRT